MLCASGIAVDPLSGDLFVSSPCPPGGGTDDIYRISNPESAAPAVSVFSSPGHAQGLAFTADGTRWATPLQNDSNNRYITDPAIYQQMVNQGWRGEGVVFCALPEPRSHDRAGIRESPTARRLVHCNPQPGAHITTPSPDQPIASIWL